MNKLHVYPNNNLSNFHFYNDISQLGLSTGASIKDILAKMPTKSIGVLYCLSKSITELPFDTQCVVTIFKNGDPFRIEVQDIWSGRTYVAIYSGGTVGKFVEYALKNDLVTRTAIALTAVNSYSFNANYTYGYKRAGWVEFQFNLGSAFNQSKNNVLRVPDDCATDKQIWFPVFSSVGGNVVARGMIYGTDVAIIGPGAINGVKDLFGHVVYMHKS